MRFIFSLLFFLSVTLISAQESRHELRDSLRILSRQLEENPSDLQLRLQKAALNMQLEEWENAIFEYNQVLMSDKENLAALFYRAYAQVRLRRYVLARNDYNSLLAIIPYHFEGRLGLALLCQKEGKLHEALDQLNLLIEQHPQEDIAYAARADVEAEEGLRDAAIYDYSEAIRLAPTNTDYLLARVQLYIDAQQFDDARRDLERLIELGMTRPSLIEFYKQLK